MNFKEFRLGNYLFVPHSTTDITMITELVSQPISGMEHGWCFGYALTALTLASACRPIPLTEEWLVKLGATKFPSGKNKWQIGDKSTRLLEYLDCRQVFIDVASSTELKHVHQLQNLYFALTGEELSIL
jgi:hypothetical protein